MSILNSWMFKSSRSPPLSLQKQQFQFERERKRSREHKTPAESWLFFFSVAGKEKHLWFECAWGSTVCFHFKPTRQTNSDRFVPLFHFCSCSLFSSNYEKTPCTNILAILLGLYVQLKSLYTCTRGRGYAETHAYSNKSAENEANNRQLQ